MLITEIFRMAEMLDQAPRSPNESSNQVMTFWHGGPWSLLEYAAAQSFIVNGYNYTVWSYEPVQNKPPQVNNFDARHIWNIEPEHIKPHETLNSIGPFADLFRYRLLHQIDDILTVDTDEFCIRPFPGDEYLFGLQHESIITNGVLRAPSKSPLVDNIIESSKKYVDNYDSVSWSRTGPHLLTKAIRDIGLSHLTFSTKAFFPIPPLMKMAPFIAKDSQTWSIEEFLEERRTFGIQLWASGVKYISRLSNFDINFDDPPKNSFYEKLVQRYC